MLETKVQVRLFLFVHLVKDLKKNVVYVENISSTHLNTQRQTQKVIATATHQTSEKWIFITLIAYTHNLLIIGLNIKNKC